MKTIRFNLLLILSLFSLSSYSQQPATQGKTPPPAKKLSSKDPEVNTVLSGIKNGKLATSTLGPIGQLLNKIGSSVIKGEIIGLTEVDQTNLPINFNPLQATSIVGTITFLNQPAKCTVIIGKLRDSTGSTKIGFSLEIELTNNYKVRDLTFLTTLGVSAAALNKFDAIDLPKPRIIFSTFESYLHPNAKVLIKSGVTISTDTKVAALMRLIRSEANHLTDGKANKLPFLAKVQDDAVVNFGIAIRFKGTTFQGFSANVSLPMQFGVDLAKIREKERNFNPNIKKPFEGLNRPIKQVTGIINQRPLSDIKDISIGNFIGMIEYVSNKLSLSFSTELNITTNAGTKYGVQGKVALTPEEIGIELSKSPSITSMPLGNGVSIENIAIALFMNFKQLVSTGVPISGFGLLGEIRFPFEGNSIAIGLAGQMKTGGGFLMMGSVQNFDARQLAIFNAKIIENIAKTVKFDTSKLTAAMQKLPPLKINEAFLYFSSEETTLGNRLFPKGLGATLDVLIGSQTAKLSLAGNATELAFMGYLSEIKTPFIVISGMGPDKKHGTADDGPIIDFIISASQPLKTNLDMSGRIELPPVKISGQGDVSMGIGRIAAAFKSNVANLFDANFDLAFDIQKIAEARIAFELNAQERKEFLSTAFKQLEKAIEKAQKGAAKVLLEPLRFLAQEIGKGVSKLDIELPKKIAASLVAKTWSGSLEIDGGGLTLPVIGKINLSIPTINFSLKEPMKAIGELAENWANKLVEDLKKLGKDIEKFGKLIGEGTQKAAEKTGKAATEAAEGTARSAKMLAERIEKEIAKIFTPKEKEELSARERLLAKGHKPTTVTNEMYIQSQRNEITFKLKEVDAELASIEKMMTEKEKQGKKMGDPLARKIDLRANIDKVKKQIINLVAIAKKYNLMAEFDQVIQRKIKENALNKKIASNRIYWI